MPQDWAGTVEWVEAWVPAQGREVCWVWNNRNTVVILNSIQDHASGVGGLVLKRSRI